MDISDINLIRTLVRLGSLSKATLELNQSQPTLSRRLLRLEDELGGKLFHRSPTGMVPTVIATSIVARAEPLHQELRAIRRQVELMTNLESGELRVGVGPIIEQLLIPNVLRRFIETTGDVRLSMVTDSAEQLLVALDRADLDIVIGPFEAAANSGRSLVSRTLISDQIIAVARSGHPLFEEAPVTAAALQRYPMVSPLAQGNVQQRPGGPRLRLPKVAADNYTLLQRLTCELDIICAGPKGIFAEGLKAGRLREIDINLGVHWEGILLTRPETLDTPLARHFVTLCEDVAAKMLNRMSPNRTDSCCEGLLR